MVEVHPNGQKNVDDPPEGGSSTFKRRRVRGVGKPDPTEEHELPQKDLSVTILLQPGNGTRPGEM